MPHPSTATARYDEWLLGPRVRHRRRVPVRLRRRRATLATGLPRSRGVIATSRDPPYS